MRPNKKLIKTENWELTVTARHTKKNIILEILIKV